MIEILLNRKPVHDFKELVKSFPKSQFDSPRRSTVLLLDSWRTFEPNVNYIEESLRADFSANCRIHFEYRVSPPKGKGKASFTDVMLCGNGTVAAVEAKFKDPAGDDVSKWLSKGNKPTNRKQVLEGWLSLIECATGVSLSAKEVSTLPYQLIHRTASACSISARSRHVVYQVFDPAKEGYYSGSLQDMSKSLQDSSAVSFWLMLCPFEPLEKYCGLLTKWDEGERKMSAKVAQALVSKSLARFLQPKFVECR